MGGFISSLTRERSEEGAGQHEDGGEDGFRWVFEGDLSGVFVARERGGGVTARDEFEGVLFETMRLFALTPHVDTREATLQTLYTVLEVLCSLWFSVFCHVYGRVLFSVCFFLSEGSKCVVRYVIHLIVVLLCGKQEGSGRSWNS